MAGVGTGGTVTGVGSFLRSRKSSVQVVAIEPTESAGKPPGPCSGYHDLLHGEQSVVQTDDSNMMAAELGQICTTTNACTACNGLASKCTCLRVCSHLMACTIRVPLS